MKQVLRLIDSAEWAFNLRSINMDVKIDIFRSFHPEYDPLKAFENNYCALIDKHEKLYYYLIGHIDFELDQI